MSDLDKFFGAIDRRIAAVHARVADPLRAAGYEVAHLGGGCLGWMRPLTADGDSYILVTNDEDLDGDPEAEEWIIGRYGGDNFICLDETFTLAEAIQVADLLPDPDPRGAGVLQATFPTLQAAVEALGPSAAHDPRHSRRSTTRSHPKNTR